ncbi:MAG TPA: hypothetical protein VFE50_07200 [Cyclobacteriaceae bacterium]|nr:hypothetical protein [Cyclobacteriaceae bacterium]
MSAVRSLIIYLILVACTSHASEAQTVYITKTGKKYHRAACQYLRKSQIEISIREAVDRGYTPCSVCEPGRPTEKTNKEPSKKPEAKSNDGSQAPTSVKPAEARSRQCSAVTKSGTRCKRMTTNANGRCYQH